MNGSFYKPYITAAEAGQTVWLGDLRASGALAPEVERLVLRLTGCDGGTEDFPLFLPPWSGDRERELARSMLCAFVFNLLSARGGRELRVFYRTENAALGALVGELGELFQLRESPRRGYGKAVSVSNRINLALGGRPFAIAAEDLRACAPLPPRRKAPAADPTGKLRRAAREAEDAFCCGMDVGGTDVKLAVSRGGELLLTREFDWDPSQSPTAERIAAPLMRLMDEALAECGEGRRFDAVGLSFPDVVIRGRILGGETPKTRGLRDNPALDYEIEFQKLGALRERMLERCVPGGRVRLTNDGNMAAFSAAMELACGGETSLEGGVVAHSLGTDLGSGWLLPDGRVPELPLEMYDFLVDLGSFPQRRYDPTDLRSVCNENSGLPGARRYLGQAACYRMAWELEPSLLDGFTEEREGLLRIRSSPCDLRKPCLEHLMAQAEQGLPEAEEIFRRIGAHLAQVSREMALILHPETELRTLYGRFVKRPRCFKLIREGCAAVLPELRLTAADESLACSPLMRRLAQREGVTVAQFGQAVGAIYFAMMEDGT